MPYAVQVNQSFFVVVANSTVLDPQLDVPTTEDLKKIPASEVRRLEQEFATLGDELCSLEWDLTAICIRERNSHVKLRMKEDFSLGLRELEQELREEGDEKADDVKHTHPLDVRDGIDTFCVCSKAYQKFSGRLPLEESPTGFNTEDDTSIPQLIQHCKEYTLNSREMLADIFLEDLGRLTERMRGWSDNTTPDNEMALWQRDSMEACFDEQVGVLEMVCCSCSANLDIWYQVFVANADFW
jgi:hypothetical protein